MKLICILVTITLLFPFGENSKEKKALAIEIGSNLAENKILCSFSHPDKKDEFYIMIEGSSILKGNVRFTITNYNRIKIYEEEFPAIFLIGHGLPFEASEIEKENFIKKRISEFFNEDNFSSPAISAEDTFDEDYSNKEIWEDIKSDQTAIGFYYLIGEGDGRSIAYSKKLKKVVMYFNCC
ncbi:hypothetical protein DF185_03010 [Marinifilum breve]|uniref:Uncharacterized protein n=1 Tax=Marinifilum breve TaxID=2184082 RepID=A0A2V4A2E8_9BACT|nr:hypothetical protein [Marinifilum breve]PXY03075.1 hypothetical protein DF185_03010 [Marinifilum breve]